MQKNQTNWKKIVGGVGLGLLAVVLVMWFVLAWQRKPVSLDVSGLLPSEGVKMVLEVQRGGVSENLLRQIWGVRGERLFEEGGVVTQTEKGWLFFFARTDGKRIVQTEDYLGWRMENSFVGEGDWRVGMGGWEVVGEKEVLMNWLEGLDGERLSVSGIWRELSGSLRESGAKLYLLGTEEETGGLLRGSVLGLEKNRLSILTLVNRTKVGVFGFGQTGEKFDGSYFKFVPEAACVAIGGKDLREQVQQVEEILVQYNPQVAEWWEAYTEGLGLDFQSFLNGEAVWWMSENERGVVYQNQAGQVMSAGGEINFEAELSVMSELLGRYVQPEVRWAAVILPEKCGWGERLREWGLSVKSVVVSEEVFEDRILTVFDFE